MLDYIIRNAIIIDGTGEKSFTGNVGIRGKKIILNPEETAKIEIDGSNRILCPGFIDSHSHSDRFLGISPHIVALCKLSQGVTTEITGQCGSTNFPISSKYLDTVKESFSDPMPEVILDHLKDFTSFKAYKSYLQKQKKGLNYAFLIGHSALRLAVMGNDNRRPTKEELNQMKEYLKEAMEEGCMGLSSGLIYVPSVYADTEELIELCKVMKPYGGIYATHMRSEADHVVEAVKEAITIAKTAKVALVISHHKVCGVRNWGASKETLALIHKAIKEGVAITLDQYPYAASQTGLCQCLPPKYFAVGKEEVAKLLHDPNHRAEMKKEMQENPPKYNNSLQNANGFRGVLILSCPGTPKAVGMTVAEYAKMCNKDEYEVYFDLMEKSNCAGRAAYFCMDEKELDAIYMDENTVVGSDGEVGSMEGPVHPRGYGTFVRSICYYSRQKGLLPLEQAIYKQTYLTAKRWGIKNKGLIQDGYDADLVLMNYQMLNDRADFTNPRRLCDGIDLVFVNGQLVYKDKCLIEENAGEIYERDNK